MIPSKDISIRAIGIILCISFLASCSSGNDVVSAKRKYRKGWFFNRAGEVNTQGANSKDSGLTNTYRASKESDKEQQQVTKTQKEDRKLDKRLVRQARRDSIKALAKAKKAEKKQKRDELAKNKTKEPPEPPDDVLIHLIVLIIVLTGLSILITGLITPIAVWKISQNFLLIAGVVLTYTAYFISVNTKLGIKSKKDNVVQRQYNLGKPAWIIALWATIPMGFLFLVVRTFLIANLFAAEIATIGLFVAGACVAVSLALAVKALFVDDRHKGKAWLALLLDAILITAAILLL